MPVSLEGYMTEREWDHLANRMDSAMLPAGRLQIILPMTMVLWFLVTITIFITTFSTRGGSQSDGLPIGPFIVVPVLFVVLVAGITVATQLTRNNIQTKALKICRNFSQKHAGTLSFHFKQKPHMYHPHIEIYYGGYITQSYLEVVIATHNNAASQPAIVEATVIEAISESLPASDR